MTATAFDNLDDYLALPRVSGLAVSADGSRVVTTVAELNDKRTEHISAVWEVDPAGERPARRLTRGANGDSSPAFTIDGDLLFVSSRLTAENTDDSKKPPASLWRLPAGGGEAIEVLSMPGGVSVVRTAHDADATVVVAPLFPAARDVVDDERLRNRARTIRLTRYCTPGTRCATGTRTSARTNLTCSTRTGHAISPRNRAGRCEMPDSTSVPTVDFW